MAVQVRPKTVPEGFRVEAVDEDGNLGRDVASVNWRERLFFQAVQAGTANVGRKLTRELVESKRPKVLATLLTAVRVAQMDYALHARTRITVALATLMQFDDIRKSPPFHDSLEGRYRMQSHLKNAMERKQEEPGA